jgi:hypothetical protein
MRYATTTAATAALVLGLLAGAVPPFNPAPAHAQVERVYHPMYLPAQHNWVFRQHYPALDRLFAAFDYGHGILYETLHTRPGAPVSLLEEDIYRHLTLDVLRNPPRMHMPERAFMPRYARLAPLAKEMFEWAHILHRQAYDILADDRIADRDAAMEELLAYYLASPLAFPDVPKGMAIMDEQYFSQVFRQRYPRFNGLIWAYHWLQVAVHEPLLLHDTPEERQTAMQALLARFWQMLEDPPRTLPSEMPMTAAIAPEFTARYPRFAAIFDNLHMMHDVISDILVSDQVADRRAEIYRQADLFRDPDAMAVTREEWIAMALGHGLDAQGGPAIGILPPVPTLAAEPHDHAAHAAPATPATPAERHEHRQPPAATPERHEHRQPPAAAPERHEHRHSPADAPEPQPQHQHDPGAHRAMALVVRLLDDAHVQQRIHAVPAFHEAWEDEGVQRHLAMMRRMHGPDAQAMDPARHEAMRETMHGDPAMHRAMAFVVALLDDPHVQHRIHAVPENHAAWEDPAVQQHLERMRRMHGGAEHHQH